MTFTPKPTTPILAAISLAIMLSCTAYADESAVEVIAVNGDYSALSLDQISQSASVVSQDILEQRQAAHIEDVLNKLANVNLASGASRAKFVQIRGIGERSQFSEPLNPSVGIILDGIDISGLGGLATLFDVQQVEVMRGPQATTFGANGLAGVINIVANAPTAAPDGQLRLSLGEDELFAISGAYSQAVSDNMNARIAISKQQNNGFVKNAFLQRDDTNGIDETGLRVTLDYAASPAHKVRLTGIHSYIDNGYDAFSLENDNITISDEPGQDRAKANALSVLSTTQTEWGQYQLSAATALTESLYSYDEDWTFAGYHPDPMLFYSAVDAYFRDRDYVTVEAKVMSVQDLEQLHWVTGLQYKKAEEQLTRQYTYADSDFNSEYQPEQLSLYAQVNWPVASQWLLETGIRAERFDLEYADSNGFVESQSDTLVGGKLGVSHFRDDSTFYASLSRGYKVGGFNPNEQVSASQRIFDAEYNWNAELGYKYATTTTQVRLAVFRMERKDTQISDFAVLSSEGNAVQFIDIIDNADNGVNQGAELEWRFTPGNAVSFGADIGYLDARFSGYTNAMGDFVASQRQAQSPRHTFHLFMDADLSETWRAYLAFEGKSSARFSDGHDAINPSYSVFNANFTKDVGPYEISFWVNNLLDEVYYSRGFGGFNNDPFDGFDQTMPEEYFQFANGRRAGITVNATF